MKRLMLLSRRVVRIAPAASTNYYRLLPPAFSGFGDEEWMERAFYEGLLETYRRVVVAIEGHDGQFLALMSSSDRNGSGFAEVDQWGRPIPIASLASLRGLELAQQIIESPDKADSLLPILVDSLERETIEFRMAVFIRLMEGLRETLSPVEFDEASASSLKELYRLLPWRESFLPIHKFIIQCFRRGRDLKSAQGSLEGLEVDRFVDLFSYLDLTWAVRTKELVLALGDYANDPSKQLSESLVHSASRFIKELKDVELNLIPRRYRARCKVDLPKELSAFLRREVPQSVRSHKAAVWRLLNRTSMEAMLLAYKTLREEHYGGLSQMLYFLAEAAISADRAGLFDEPTEAVGNLIQQMRDMIRDLPRPNKLLQDTASIPDAGGEVQSVPLEHRFGEVMYAAEICRLYVRHEYAFTEHDRWDLLTLLQLARGYYEFARLYLHHVELPGKQGRRALLYKQYSLCLTLEAELANSLGGNAVSEVQEQIRALVDDMTHLSDLNFQEKVSRFLVRAAGVGHLGMRDFESEVVREAEELIEENPRDSGPFESLFHYYELVGDLPKAIDVLDRQQKIWTEMGRSPADIGWLLHQSATLCKEAGYKNQDTVLLVESAKRYAELLKLQPSNPRAGFDLVEVLDELDHWGLVRTMEYFDKILLRLDDKDCPLIHAAIRISYLSESLPLVADLESSTGGLVRLIQGADQNSQSVQRLRAVPLVLLSFAIELVSKAYFERGRFNPKSFELSAAERVIDFYLNLPGKSAKQPDVILLTRKLDIHLQRKEFGAAREVLDRLSRAFPEDEISKLKSAVLARLEGRVDDARRVLESEIERTSPLPHPALINELALLELGLGRLERARLLYQQILRRTEYDPIAHFGLGRSYFEAGPDFWPSAFEEWVRALRIRAAGRRHRDVYLSKLTARSLASVISIAQPEEGRGVLLEMLGKALRVVGSRVFALMVDALIQIGAVDGSLADTVYEATTGTMSVSAHRKVAQYLMARSIALILLESPRIGEINEIERYVRWAQDRGVLAEYLAGAKGFYNRAIARLLLMDKLHIGFASEDMGRDDVAKMPLPVREFFLHVSQSREGQPDPNYYRRAYQLVGGLTDLSMATKVGLVHALVKGISSHLWRRKAQKPGRLQQALTDTSASISLWPLKTLVGAINGSTQVGGWVDADALSLVETEFGHRQWRLEGPIVWREVQAPPPVEDAVLLARFGIFSTDGEDQNGHRYRLRVEASEPPTTASVI